VLNQLQYFFLVYVEEIFFFEKKASPTMQLMQASQSVLFCTNDRQIRNVCVLKKKIGFKKAEVLM